MENEKKKNITVKFTVKAFFHLNEAKKQAENERIINWFNKEWTEKETMQFNISLKLFTSETMKPYVSPKIDHWKWKRKYLRKIFLQTSLIWWNGFSIISVRTLFFSVVLLIS